MFITWRITDDLSNVTIDEFDKEWNGIYGFIKLKIGDNVIGCIPNEDNDIEGNSDILYYLMNFIECGFNMISNTNYSFKLLELNLLMISVNFTDKVNICLVDTEIHEVLWKAEITQKDLLKEIENNYLKFYNYIILTNKNLLQTKMVKSIINMYNTFNDNLFRH